MVTVLILFTGILTDRIGGAGALVWGNIIYSLGSIVIASATQVRSYKLMIGGIVIQALGDIATQVRFLDPLCSSQTDPSLIRSPNTASSPLGLRRRMDLRRPSVSNWE
jgi:MFS family permease